MSDGFTSPTPSGSLNIMPGVSFGPFRLHDRIIHVVETLRRDGSRYGNVEVDVDPLIPVGQPVTLGLPKIDTVLRFSPKKQLLDSIMIQNLHRCGEIIYKGKVFSSGRAMPATFSRIYDVLGPTFQGDMLPDGCYILKYPGIQIGFNIPAKYREEFNAGGDAAHPMVFSDGTTPVASFLVIEATSPPPPPAGGRIPLDCSCSVVASPKGATFGDRLLAYGASPQDAVTLLGLPTTICPKKDERLLIHRPTENAQRTATTVRPFYFYNYPHLGVDLAFDGRSNTLQKIICFNSVPPDESFLRYCRCHFAVDAAMMAPLALVQDTVLNGNTKWASIEAVLKDSNCPIPKPLLATTRHGVVKIYSFVGIVVDVLATGMIGKITLFNTSGATASNSQQRSKEPQRLTQQHSPISISPAMTLSRAGTEMSIGGASPTNPTTSSALSSTVDSTDESSLDMGNSPVPESRAESTASASAREQRGHPVVAPAVHYPPPAAFEEDPASSSPMKVQLTAQMYEMESESHTQQGDDDVATPPHRREDDHSENVFDAATESSDRGGAIPNSRHGFLAVEDDDADLHTAETDLHTAEGDDDDAFDEEDEHDESIQHLAVASPMPPASVWGTLPSANAGPSNGTSFLDLLSDASGKKKIVVEEAAEDDDDDMTQSPPLETDDLHADTSAQDDDDGGAVLDEVAVAVDSDDEVDEEDTAPKKPPPPPPKPANNNKGGTGWSTVSNASSKKKGKKGKKR